MNICSSAFIDKTRPCVVRICPPALRGVWCPDPGAQGQPGGYGVAEKGRHRQRKPIGIYTYPHKIISQAPYKKGGGGCENPKPEKF